MSSFNREMQGRLITYFKQKLGVYQHTTGWLRQGLCPNCSKEHKFGINLWMNRTNCFSCGYHPKPLLLVMKLEDLETYTQVYNFLNAFEQAEYLETHIPMLEEKEVKLPESFKLLGFAEGRMGRIAVNYMRNRGYNINALTMKGVGFCTTGDYKYRIIIPFYERGKLIYFNARQFIEFSTKHKNPSVTEFGIGKSQIIYNVDALHIYDSVYALESATNALTLGDKAIATGGKLASDYQLSKVLRSPCKKVTIILDPDAHWEALHMGLQLANHKKVRVVKLPHTYKGKKNPDVNDLGKAKSLEFIKTTPYLNYKELYRLFLREPRPIYHAPIA